MTDFAVVPFTKEAVKIAAKKTFEQAENLVKKNSEASLLGRLMLSHRCDSAQFVFDEYKRRTELQYLASAFSHLYATELLNVFSIYLRDADKTKDAAKTFIEDLSMEMSRRMSEVYAAANQVKALENNEGEK